MQFAVKSDRIVLFSSRYAIELKRLSALDAVKWPIAFFLPHGERSAVTEPYMTSYRTAALFVKHNIIRDVTLSEKWGPKFPTARLGPGTHLITVPVGVNA